MSIPTHPHPKGSTHDNDNNNASAVVVVVSNISGNAPDEVKRLLGDPLSFFGMRAEKRRVSAGALRLSAEEPIFGQSIVGRMVVKEVSVVDKTEEVMKKEGRVVCEVVVDHDMANGSGNIHGGCSAFLIDVCSTMALTALEMTTRSNEFMGVSQSLNITYHSPAGLGDTLRLVNTTLTTGARAFSARTEVWNATKHRLVASGVHVKMQPSSPPSIARL